MYRSPQSAFGNASHQRALKRVRSRGKREKIFSWNNNCSVEAKLKKKEDKWSVLAAEEVIYRDLLRSVLPSVFVFEMETRVNSYLAKFVNNLRSDWEELQKDLMVMNDWAVKKQAMLHADGCRGEIQPHRAHTAGAVVTKLSVLRNGTGATGGVLWKHQCSSAAEKANQVLGMMREEES